MRPARRKRLAKRLAREPRRRALRRPRSRLPDRVWIDRCLFPTRARKILALTDDAAAGHFRGQTWMDSALHDLDVEVIVVPLPDDLRRQIASAQTRQFRSEEASRARRIGRPSKPISLAPP